MKRLAELLVTGLLLLATSLPSIAGSAHPREGRLEPPLPFASRHVPERVVQIWLPPGYPEPGRRYPVLYMHDGQNVFARAPSDGSGFGNWGTDLTMERLIAAGDIPPAIVVGIYNTRNRTGEYMPQAAYRLARAKNQPVGSSNGTMVADADIQSDNYLKFIVEELKPYIDAHYRTRPDRDHTFIMGSSMGGLISLYAISEYPQVFGAAACLSTHWPIGGGAMVDYVRDRFPDPATHRIYFDRGTQTLDASYPAYQSSVDRIMQAHGYIEGRNFESRVFDGARHDEKSWAARLDVPLKFLLGSTAQTRTPQESDKPGMATPHAR